jgi:NAD(P)-dependent dehydrogenase (short-subunit alcohol dehydrogenase family)
MGLEGLLEGKVAIVTGVSAGVGAGIARAFVDRGAQVVGLARRKEQGEALRGEMKVPDNYTFVQTDISVVDDCARAAAAAVEPYGRIDILINNAGSSGPRPVVPAVDTTEAEWDEVLDTNLKGAFFMCKHALPHLIAGGGGTIINIASIGAEVGLANMSHYNASKAGLVQMTRTLAVEHLQNGVRANVILLGMAASAMADGGTRAMGQFLRGPEFEPSLPNPLEMDPYDVGRTLALLCCDDARLITGATIAVDTGMSAGLLGTTLSYLACAELLPR